MYYKIIESPLGELALLSTKQHLIAVNFMKKWTLEKAKYSLENAPQLPLLNKVATQLNEYFTKKRQSFDIPLKWQGTAFQQQAWEALLAIPYGETWSYSQQARYIHKPKAVRAIGRANGANSIAIIVPCHRVIGQSGALTGYASGLDIKHALLALEGRL